MSSTDDNSDEKKAKLECSYGEKCCRQNEAHFRDYEHPHLDRLLLLSNNSVTIPSDYELHISRATLIKQLSAQRDINSGASTLSVPFDESARDYSHLYAHTSSSSSTGNLCIYGESCFQQNEDHLVNFRHPHLDKLIGQMKDLTTFPQSYEFRISKATLLHQIKVITNYRDRKSPDIQLIGMERAITEPDWNPIQEEDSLKRYNRILMDARSQNMEELVIQYSDMPEKLALSEPYNFFLTSVIGSSSYPLSIDDPLAVSFQELLGPAMGKLINSLQVNCLVEVGWLLEQYRLAKPDGPPLPLTLIYSQADIDSIDPLAHNFTHAKVEPPDAFGAHHTKMMIFEYADKSIRIVVLSANLMESDWLSKTQGLWISPRCPQLPESSTVTDGESCTNFKQDILRYFTSYKLAQLAYWITYLARADMSSIKVFFLASVPGTFLDDRHNWGLCALSKIVNDHVTTQVDQTCPVYVQCSSIGSLGKRFETSILAQIRDAFCPDHSTPPLHVFYPSENDVKRSYDEILGGSCLLYSEVNHEKQKWLEKYLCNWISNSRHRSRAVPHMQTYSRVSEDNKKLAVFVLTSANVSKAGWGSLNNNKTKLFMRSYEAGVVFLPKIMIQEDFFPLEKNENFAFPLPFDLPVIKYSIIEKPFTTELLEKYTKDKNLK